MWAFVGHVSIYFQSRGKLGALSLGGHAAEALQGWTIARCCREICFWKATAGGLGEDWGCRKAGRCHTMIIRCTEALHFGRAESRDDL